MYVQIIFYFFLIKYKSSFAKLFDRNAYILLAQQIKYIIHM